MQLVEGDAGRCLLTLPRNQLWKLQIDCPTVITCPPARPQPSGCLLQQDIPTKRGGFHQNTSKGNQRGCPQPQLGWTLGWPLGGAGEARGPADCGDPRTTKGLPGWHAAGGQL